jgi:hypothetical protein
VRFVLTGGRADTSVTLRLADKGRVINLSGAKILDRR